LNDFEGQRQPVRSAILATVGLFVVSMPCFLFSINYFGCLPLLNWFLHSIRHI